MYGMIWCVRHPVHSDEGFVLGGSKITLHTIHGDKNRAKGGGCLPWQRESGVFFVS